MPGQGWELERKMPEIQRMQQRQGWDRKALSVPVKEAGTGIAPLLLSPVGTVPCTVLIQRTGLLGAGLCCHLPVTQFPAG